jgi:hypothetical protein
MKQRTLASWSPEHSCWACCHLSLPYYHCSVKRHPYKLCPRPPKPGDWSLTGLPGIPSLAGAAAALCLKHEVQAAAFLNFMDGHTTWRHHVSTTVTTVAAPVRTVQITQQMISARLLPQRPRAGASSTTLHQAYKNLSEPRVLRLFSFLVCPPSGLRSYSLLLHERRPNATDLPLSWHREASLVQS